MTELVLFRKELLCGNFNGSLWVEVINHRDPRILVSFKNFNQKGLDC